MKMLREIVKDWPPRSVAGKSAPVLENDNIIGEAWISRKNQSLTIERRADSYPYSTIIDSEYVEAVGAVSDQLAGLTFADAGKLTVEGG